MAGHGRKATEQYPPTGDSKGRDKVRRWKESGRARGTHFLKAGEEVTSQDMEGSDRARSARGVPTS